MLASAPCLLAAAASENRVAAEKAASAKAAQNLLQNALSLKIGDQRTVREFIAATEMPKTDLRPLLQGAVEYEPARFYGDGTCEVRVAISPEALRANLQRIKQEHYKQADGEFAKAAFDPPAGKNIEGIGVSPASPRGKGASAPTEGIPGWDSVSNRKRITAERAACGQAMDKAKASAEAVTFAGNMTLGEIMGKNAPARQAVEKFFQTSLPENKVYLPNGVVEVKVAADNTAIWDALIAANKAVKEGAEKMDENLLAAARQRDAGQQIVALGYAQADGRTVTPADIAQSTIPLDSGAMSDLALDQRR